MTNVKKLIIIGCLIYRLIISSPDLFSQPGWYQQVSGTSLNLNSVQFLNDNTGYIAGGFYGGTGIILKTTNSGSNWFTSLIIPGLGFKLALYFLDINTGTVAGSSPFKKTTNGGITWFDQPNPYFSAAYDIKYINSSIGMAVGTIDQNQNGGIIYTTDGGATWLNRGYGHDYFHYDVELLDANTAVVVGNFHIIRTTNSGLTWTFVSPGPGLSGLSFLNSNKGVACGGGTPGVVLNSTNSGNNWITIYNSSNRLLDIDYIDTNNIITVGQNGSIYKSINGGINWIQQTSGTTEALNGVWFVNPNTGWAVGNNGIILKTTTGGFTAIHPISNQIPNEYKLYQNYPNPFNPVTKIHFAIPSNVKSETTPEAGKLSNIKIIIFDILGNEATSLVNEQLKPGTYEVEFDGTNYPSGVYYYKLEATNYSKTKKMVLLK